MAVFPSHSHASKQAVTPLPCHKLVNTIAAFPEWACMRRLAIIASQTDRCIVVFAFTCLHLPCMRWQRLVTFLTPTRVDVLLLSWLWGSQKQSHTRRTTLEGDKLPAVCRPTQTYTPVGVGFQFHVCICVRFVIVWLWTAGWTRKILWCYPQEVPTGEVRKRWTGIITSEDRILVYQPCLCVFNAK